MRYNFIAACMMHVEGYYSIKSIAFRNNNPGNIEDHPGHYAVYATKLQGYEALVNDIIANKGKTLRQFISKYAPPNENDTNSYMSIVSTLSQVGLDEVL